MSCEAVQTTIGGGKIDHTAAEKMYKPQAWNLRRGYLSAVPTSDPKLKKLLLQHRQPWTWKSYSTGQLCLYHPPANLIKMPPLIRLWQKWEHAETVPRARPMNLQQNQGEYLLKPIIWREVGHLSGFSSQRKQHKETLTNRARRLGRLLQQRSPYLNPKQLQQTNINSSVRTLLTEKDSKTQLNRGAAKAEIFESQNAPRSARAVAKGEMAVQESGRRLLVQEIESESEPPGWITGEGPHLISSSQDYLITQTLTL